MSGRDIGLWYRDRWKAVKARELARGTPEPTYKDRNALLVQMGFSTYKEYLNSELWAEIRDAVLTRANHQCELCGRERCVVHHIDYSEKTLCGESLDSLVALCWSCHKIVEFKKSGGKRTLVAAGVMYDRLRATRKSD